MRGNVQPLFPTQEAPQEAVGARFEELWKLWPNKAKKPLARAKYRLILQGGQTRTLDKDSNEYVTIELEGTEDQIIEGCRKYLETQKATGSGAFGYKDGGKWIPHLATFLNQGRHEDFL